MLKLGTQLILNYHIITMKKLKQKINRGLYAFSGFKITHIYLLLKNIKTITIKIFLL